MSTKLRHQRPQICFQHGFQVVFAPVDGAREKRGPLQSDPLAVSPLSSFEERLLGPEVVCDSGVVLVSCGLNNVPRSYAIQATLGNQFLRRI